MGNSLQEQLLKAGLINEEQLRKATAPPPRAPRRSEPAKGDKRRRKRPKASGGPGASAPPTSRGPGASAAPAAAASPSTPPPAVPAGPTIEELNARIRKLLDEHRQNADDAELPYNFTRESRIKKLYVTEEQRRALLAGELAIAGYRRVHHVIPTGVAEEILSLRPEIFVHRADPPEALAPASEDVPDDLVW